MTEQAVSPSPLSVASTRPAAASDLSGRRPDTAEYVLIAVLNATAIAIGAVALAGYIAGDTRIAAVFPTFKPVSAVTAISLILLGVAAFALESNRRWGSAVANVCSAVCVTTATAELALRMMNSAALNLGARHGVLLHPFVTTSALLLLLSVALASARRLELVTHVLASIVLFAATAIVFGYVLEVESFIEPSRHIAPVRATIVGLALLSVSTLLLRPRGWVAILMSRTATGLMLRLVLPAAIVAPLLSARLLPSLAHQDWYSRQVELTLITVSDVVFSVMLIFGAGALLYTRELRERQLEDQRRAAAAYARSLIEASLDPLVTISVDGKITDVNAATELVTGRNREALIGTDFSDYFTEPEKAREGYRKVFAEGQVRDYPLTIQRVDGHQTEVLYNATLYRDGSGEVRGIFAAARDITERKRIEDREVILNRVLRAIAEANQVLIREHDESTLLESVCRVVVDYAGFRMAWIGIADYEAGRVVPVAVAGKNDGYVERLDILLDGSPQGRGPTALAIKEGRPQIVDDFEADERTAPWREAALAHGFVASAVFPLLQKKKPWGALTVYSPHARAFRGEAATMLEGLAANVALTIEAITAEKERAEAEERVRQANAYNRNLLETSLDPIVTISATGTITDVNAATEAATGCSRDELIGSDFSDYFTEPERARDGYRSVLAAGAVRDYPLTLRHRNGTTIDVLYNATVYRDAAGVVQGVFAAARDVTERKRADEIQSRLAAIVESSSDGIVATGLDGRIITWNHGAEELYGYTAAEMIGRRVSIIPPPERKGEIEDLLQRIRRGERITSFETVRVRKDGSLIDVALTVSPLRDTDGNIIGASTIVRDITERKKAAEQLAKTLADLERSNKELEQFAYVASHDLQEPLRMVSSFTQLLAQRYGEKLDKNGHEFIAFAVDGANRMQRLINDLLTYSRVGTRGGAFQRTDSHAALGVALVNLATMIAETPGAMITCDDLPVVFADDGQLVQLFQNLIGNAIKFRRTDEPPRIRVSAVPDGGMWRFAVADNGIGIAPEFQSRLFVIFQRLHGRDEYPGTGIGLAICKRIVDRHGGRIWMESQPGKGSTFYFTLPAEQTT